MTVDVDQILRAHAEAAGRVAPDPDGWDRLVARLEEGSPGDATPPARPTDARPAGADRGRWPVLAAAAVLVVVAVSAAVALVRSADGGEATTPATEATAPTDATEGTGTTGDPDATDGETGEPGDPTDPASQTTADTQAPDTGVADPEADHTPEGPRPESVIAVVDGDGDGLADVVRLDRIGPGGGAGDGRVDPGDPTVLVPGSDVSPAAITDVDVTADGTVLYLVGEEVWRIDPTSGLTSGPVAQGTAMAVSGDGRVLATVIGDVIRLYGLDARGGQRFADMTNDDGEVTALALSQDGTQIARQRVTRAADGTIATTAVDVTFVAFLGRWEEVERSSGVGLPAFMPDGHLAVGLGTEGASAGHDEVRASEVGMADLTSGEVRWSVGGGGFSFTTFDASPDGTWVAVLEDDGVIRAFAAIDGWLWDSGTVVLLGGMVDAAW